MNEIEGQLALLLGEDALVIDKAAQERYLVDWTRMTIGAAKAIVRPASVQDLARCVTWCAKNGVGIVPQGGHTGLAGGATPIAGERQIVISLERLNQVRAVDPVSNTITVEAGVILRQVQESAERVDRLFPLSLGAEGSCQIGGCIATNAGGTAVLRYGNTRELVLGLEVVLPDGTLWSQLKALRKDNAGFDLKHLFIGTEGTLGIVTAATLRLFARPRQTATALVGVSSVQAVIDLFVRVRNAFDSELTAFEFMTAHAMQRVCAHRGKASPLPSEMPLVVLLELSSPHRGTDLHDALVASLESAAEEKSILDAAIAASEQHAAFFWMLRESIPEAMLRAYPQQSNHDISIPIASIPEFIERAEAITAAHWPELSTLLFGHVGDGNLHFNFVASQPLEADRFSRVMGEAVDALYRLTAEFDGSISAEHGVGQHKMELLQQLAPSGQLRIMRILKEALDEHKLMNPGKVLPPV